MSRVVPSRGRMEPGAGIWGLSTIDQKIEMIEVLMIGVLVGSDRSPFPNITTDAMTANAATVMTRPVVFCMRQQRRAPNAVP
jgi:hypothetical protein